MPNSMLDTDEKYTKLAQTYSKLEAEKILNPDNDLLKSKCKIFDNILEALNWLTQRKDDTLKNQLNFNEKLTPTDNITNNNEKINVLITGSLYLVGLSLKVLKYKID